MRGAVAHVAVIGLLLAGIYGPALDGSFQYDDLHTIVDNPSVRSLAHVPSYFTDPGSFSSLSGGGMFRPLVLLSYAFQHTLHGYSAFGYKLFNLAVHLAVCLTLYALARQFCNPRASFAAALLFAVHPINSQAVSYVSARSESMCWLFVLLSTLAYIASERKDRQRLYWLAPACLGLALLCKSVAVVLPLILLLWEAIRPAPPEGRRLPVARIAPMVVVVAAYLIVVRTAIAVAVVDAPVRSLATNMMTQIKVLTYYLKLILVPTRLSVVHAFDVSPRPGLDVLLALGLLASLGAILWMSRRHRQSLQGATVWMAAGLFTLVPTALIPLNILVNEHRVYALVAGACVGVVALSWRRPCRPLLAPLLVLGFILFPVLSHGRAQTWRTPATLWQDALAKAPDMPRPHLFIGDELHRQGRHRDALAAYDRALKVNPEILSGGDRLAIFNNAGAAYAALGETPAAMAAYEQALRLDSTYAPSRVSLQALVALTDEWDRGARRLYKEGLQLVVSGSAVQAAERLSRALAIEVRPEILMGLSVAYRRQGRDADSRDVLRRLLLLFPESGFAEGARQQLAGEPQESP